MVRGTALLSLCFAPLHSRLHLWFLAKNINKTIELLKYKFIRKQEGIDQRNKAILSIVLRVKTVKLTGLAFVEFASVSTGFGQKRAN
jgi:hypothetical protein